MDPPGPHKHQTQLTSSSGGWKMLCQNLTIRRSWPRLCQPIDSQSATPEAVQDLQTYGHKLASVVRFATPVDGRAAVGAVTPATDRPASASEHQRWEVRALLVFKASTALLSLILL